MTATTDRTDAGESGRHPRLALLLLGGGARAAYQVGFLRCMARYMPGVRFSIVHGVSSGAINAVHLASRTCPFPRAVDELSSLWAGLTPEAVMEVDSLSLAKNALLWGLQLLSGGTRLGPGPRALVDCGPLRSLLERHLDGPEGAPSGISENLEAGRLDGVALTATRYATAGSVTFVQGCEFPDGWSRQGRTGIREPLTVRHVMASAALPLLFPAVRLGGAWYGDGGIRLATPLAPSIGLGADRIVAISTHFEEDGGGSAGTESSRQPLGTAPEAYPPPAQVAGTLLNAVFVDHLREDLRRLERINELLDARGHRGVEERDGDGLRTVRAFVLRPSRDLGRLAREHEHRLPGTFRFMVRGLGTRDTPSPDLLSMVLFEPRYLQELMEIGQEDAERRRDELEAFVRDTLPAPTRP